MVYETNREKIKEFVQSNILGAVVLIDTLEERKAKVENELKEVYGWDFDTRENHGNDSRGRNYITHISKNYEIKKRLDELESLSECLAVLKDCIENC